MKKILFTLLLFPMFCFSATIAGRGVFAAERFFDTINKHKIEDLVSVLKTSLPQESMEFLSKIQKDKIITAKIKDDKVTFSDGKFIKFNDDGSVMLNGVRFMYDITLSAQENYQKILKLNTNFSKLNLLVPNAYAQVGEGIMALFYIGGAVVAAGVAVVAVVGNEIYESVKDGTVECNGKFFSLRSKTHKALIWASSKSTIIEPKDVSVILGRQVTACDDKSAKELQIRLKNKEVFGNIKSQSPDSSVPTGNTNSGHQNN